MPVIIDDKALGNLTHLSEAFEIGLRHGKTQAGEHLVRTSRKGQASGRKSGRLYGSHKASAAGEYSAPRRWKQHNGIAYRVTETGFEFGATQPYSGYLENGTRKMDQRPDLGNAVNEGGDEVARILGEVVFRQIIGGK